MMHFFQYMMHFFQYKKYNERELSFFLHLQMHAMPFFISQPFLMLFKGQHHTALSRSAQPGMTDFEVSFKEQLAIRSKKAGERHSISTSHTHTKKIKRSGFHRIKYSLKQVFLRPGPLDVLVSLALEGLRGEVSPASCWSEKTTPKDWNVEPHCA